MKLKNLIPNKFINESKNVNALKSSYEKAIKKEQELSSLMLTNLVKYKQAKASGDEKAIAKHTKIAGQLSPKKKKASEVADKSYQAYEDAISGLHADAELQIDEALARGLKPLLMIGSTIKSNVGEDALVKLSDKFEDIDDEQADDIASHLNMGIELMQDRSPSEARGWFKKFNNACKDALKGKPTKSAFENNDPAVRFKKLAGITEAGGTGVFEPGDKYSNDFDYTGMLRWGAEAPDITFDNIGTMEAASESFTDVNYHTEGADLGNAIEWFQDTGPDEPRVLDFMKSFRAACAKALGEIDRN